MPAGKWDTTIEQGATWERVLTWADDTPTPVDLSGYSARMSLRAINTAIQSIYLSTVTGGIVLGGAAGTITLSMTAIETSALPATPHLYDLELVASDTSVVRLLQGMITVLPEQTKGVDGT